MPPLIPPPPFDLVSIAGIGGLTWLVAGAVAWMWRTWLPASASRAISAIGGWLIATGGLAASGQLARVDVVPPPAALMFAVVLGGGVTLGLSRIGQRLAAAVPLVFLVGLHAFRLPLELVMHHAGERGIMPPELSYGGYNFDIVTGAGAVLLALLMVSGVAVPRAAVWLWNAWGLWCLAVIAAVAMASSPMLRAFGDDPRHINSWVLHLPYVWLPAWLVVVALAGHVVVTRALLRGSH